MPEIIYEFIIAYIIYKIVFGFFVPLYRTGKMMQDSMTRMQKDMARAQEQFHQEQQQPSTAKANKIDDDYIDYEEVK